MDKRELAAAFRERLQALLGGGAGRDRRVPARHRRRPLGAQPVPRPGHRPAAAGRDAAAHRRGARGDGRLAAQPLERAGGPAGGGALGADREGRGPRRRLADRQLAAGGGGHEAALRALEPARHAAASPRTRRRRRRTPSPAQAGERARRLPARATWTWRSPCRCRRCRTSPSGTGLWLGVDRRLRRRQLAHMAATCAEIYPTLRLHLYDGRETFAAPFTVFGRIRAAIYLGEAYLVVTSDRAGGGAVTPVRQPGAPRHHRPGPGARDAAVAGRRDRVRLASWSPRARSRCAGDRVVKVRFLLSETMTARFAAIRAHVAERSDRASGKGRACGGCRGEAGCGCGPGEGGTHG